jgi:hypothetical protein
MIVASYAPYLRRLGLHLKRRQIPRNAPRKLQFSEVQTDPQPPWNFPFNIRVTVTTETTISAGYIVLEIDGAFANMSSDLLGAKLISGDDMKFIDNPEVERHVHKYELSKFIIAIGKSPFTPERPIHINLSGKSSPVHVANLTLFDE